MSYDQLSEKAPSETKQPSPALAPAVSRTAAEEAEERRRRLMPDHIASFLAMVEPRQDSDSESGDTAQRASTLSTGSSVVGGPPFPANREARKETRLLQSELDDSASQEKKGCCAWLIGKFSCLYKDKSRVAAVELDAGKREASSPVREIR